MRNRYEIRGQITVIFTRRKDGKVIETFIDTIDLNKANEHPGRWYTIYDPEINNYYVYGNIKKNNDQWTTIKLHRWLIDAKNEFHVDHINHNSLDNRRTNLREVTNQQNGENLKGAMKNSKSRIRGVSWHKLAKKWIVQMTVNKKYIYIGLFVDLEEAEKAAIEARKKYMPYAVEESTLAGAFCFWLCYP